MSLVLQYLTLIWCFQVFLQVPPATHAGAGWDRTSQHDVPLSDCGHVCRCWRSCEFLFSSVQLSWVQTCSVCLKVSWEHGMKSSLLSNKKNVTKSFFFFFLYRFVVLCGFLMFVWSFFFPAWGRFYEPFTTCAFIFKWRQLIRTNSFLLSQRSVHSGPASLDDCGWAFPAGFCLISFPWWDPTLSLDSIVSTLWHWTLTGLSWIFA